jgi:hypothetical protein
LQDHVIVVHCGRLFQPVDLLHFIINVL